MAKNLKGAITPKTEAKGNDEALAILNSLNNNSSNYSSVKLDKVTIDYVTEPDVLADVANNKGLKVTDVFVRIKFTYAGKEFNSSNKLGVLGMENYKALLNAKATGATVNLLIKYDVINGYNFFTVIKDAQSGTTLADLEALVIKEKEATKQGVKKVSSIASIIAKQ